MTPLLQRATSVGARLFADRSTAVAVSMLTVLVLLALAAPLLPLAEPNQTELARRLLPPLSAGNVLGTDQLGRDVLSRLLHGARLSLWVALLGVSIAAFTGSALGLLAGYFEGRVDGVLMRLIDVLMAFPYLLLALAIVVVLGPGLDNAMLAIAIVNVPFFARTVRGQTLSLKRETFVDAARVSGLSDLRILWSELLPGVTSTIAIAASTSVGWMVLETAGLSFLGLGAQPPTADLGGMLGQGRHLLATAPHVSLVPGVFIFCVVGLFNIVGDGLRDALDPRHTAAGQASSVAREDSQSTGTVPARASGKSERSTPSASSTSLPLLSVENLTLGFGSASVVHDVSFVLARGERVALVGESGSGKSVTSRAILNLLEAPGEIRAGRIFFDGQSLLDASTRWQDLRGGRIAWIPQDPMTSLHPLRRIETQIGESLRLHRGLGKLEARPVALSLLREVGIVDPEARLRAFPHQLSGGMRQRVVIAMALAGEPDLLIADEPTTALDVTTQANVLFRLEELCHRRNAALLFISHDLAVVSQLCERVLVMYRGRLVEEGATESIIEAPRHDYTRRLLDSVPKLGDPQHILAAGGGA